MSQYDQPAPGAPAPVGKPASVQTAVKLIWVGIALSVVSTLLSFVYLDEIVDNALEGSNVDEDAARIGAIGGIVFVLVVFAALYAVLAYFIGKGANWARIVYVVLAVASLLFGVLGIADQPALLLVLGVVGYLVTIATLYFLFRPDANAYFKTDRRFAA